MSPLDVVLLTLLVTTGWLASALAASPCSSAPYAELLFLSAFAPAESFCSAHYPPLTVTVSGPAKHKLRHRALDNNYHSTTTTTTTTKSHTTTTLKTTTSSSKPTTSTTTTKPTTT